MKLQHFALACLFILLSAGVYLTMKTDMEASREEQQRFNEKLLDRLDKLGSGKKEDAPAAAPTALPAEPVAVVAEPPAAPETAGAPVPLAPPVSAEGALLEKEERLLRGIAPAEATETIAEAADASTAPKISRLQERIKQQTAIAKISDARTSADFVVIDAGKNANITPGDIYAVRRGTAIVARLVIGDTVEANEAIANVKKLVTGMTLQNGDELILFDEQ